MLLATVQVPHADLLRKQGDKEAALALYADIERQLVELLEARPDVPQVRGMLDVVQTSVQTLHDELGHTEAATAARLRSVETMQRLAETDAENRAAQSGRADDLAEQGEALVGQGAIGEAAALFQESLETLEAMAVQFPDDSGVQTSLELALMRAAGSLNDGELYGRAEAAARRLLEIREAELQLAPDDADAIKSVTGALYELARAVDGSGALEDAMAVHHRRLRLEQQLAAGGADNRATRADTHYAIGLLAWRLSRREEAMPHYARHNELLDELRAESPDDSDIRINLGHGLLNLGELRVLTGDRPGALDAFQQCLEVRRTLVESGLNGPGRLMELAWAEARLAQFGDEPMQRWRQVETLLTRADASTPLGDLEEELLTVARITLSSAP